MNFLSKTALATACAISFSVVTTPAAALSPEQKRYATFAFVSFASWGAIKSFDTVMNRYVNSSPGQDVWGGSISTVCGAVAAALGNEWSPPKTVVSSHAIGWATLKSSSVIGTSVACGWGTVALMKWHAKEFTTKANNGTGKYAMPEAMRRTNASVKTVQADFYRARDLYVRLNAAYKKNSTSCGRITDIAKMKFCSDLATYIGQLNNTYVDNLKRTKNSLEYMAQQLDWESNVLGLDIPNR